LTSFSTNEAKSDANKYSLQYKNQFFHATDVLRQDNLATLAIAEFLGTFGVRTTVTSQPSQ